LSRLQEAIASALQGCSREMPRRQESSGVALPELSLFGEREICRFRCRSDLAEDVILGRVVSFGAISLTMPATTTLSLSDWRRDAQKLLLCGGRRHRVGPERAKADLLSKNAILIESDDSVGPQHGGLILHDGADIDVIDAVGRLRRLVRGCGAVPPTSQDRPVSTS